MRESWIDSWKGLLIFLVVVGHVVGMMCHYTAGETSRFMSLGYKWIYLFHKFPIVALQSLGTLQRVMSGLGNVTALGVALCIAIGVTAIAWGVTWCVRRVMPWAVGEK